MERESIFFALLVNCLFVWWLEKKKNRAGCGGRGKRGKSPALLDNVILPKFDMPCQEKYIRFKQIIKSGIMPKQPCLCDFWLI